MRLHRLEVTAFGPFAGRVEVDLDELSSAGLFLLSGPTGAGKTSVLDAICFALYGDVPGDRAAAKRLRSDHAPAGVAPRVVLEATLAGRRFRISRSPAWERPKKRGTGTTTEQASVTLAERRGGEWVTLTTRLDEAGHQVSGLLGMTLGQFTQVAMLPQGRFQAFLRARAEERKELLQRLFRTERFADVERWLRERRLELRRRGESLGQRVADVVSRVSEATETPLPDDWDLTDLGALAEDATLTGWADGLGEGLHAEHVVACQRAGDAVAAETAARTALEDARGLVERQRRHRAAVAERRELDAEADEMAQAGARVEAARRAAAVVPLERVAARARAAESAARSAAPGDTDLETARAAARAAADAAAAARALLPQGRRLIEVDAQLASRARALSAVQASVAELSEAEAAAPERREVLHARAEETREAAARLPGLRQRADAYLLVDTLGAELETARRVLAEARATALDLRSAALDVRAARLESMAAELAGALAVGASCPVCGSAEHPHRATPVPGAPDAAAERAAQKAADDASMLEHLRDVEVRELVTRLELAREQAGPAQEQAALVANLEATAALALGRDRALTELEAFDARRDKEARRLAEARTEAADHEATIQHLEQEAGQLRAAVEEALADVPAGQSAGTIEELVALREDETARRRAAVTRIEALDRAVAARDEAERTALAAAHQAGFADVDAALAAELSDDDIATLTARQRHHERRAAVVAAILAEPGAEALAAGPAPDLVALEGAHAAALAAMGAAQSAVAGGATRLARLAELRDELDQALAAWAPLRAELALATRLASFAEGKSADNRLQMSLSAYVVAYRLTQVVAAANERLAVMSDRRYQLEHSAGRGAGDRRGGLALCIRDDWSGETRDPATLSGGETFVVSLALALGLADVIGQESGGAMLETLFVDEGFGSLDADTLDDVMDVLDGLRDGGRVVGIVSHVAELRDRIPTQLLVTKSRAGSTITLR
jgi:DNA repair protein SbcC/Rad50